MPVCSSCIIPPQCAPLAAYEPKNPPMIRIQKSLETISRTPARAVMSMLTTAHVRVETPRLVSMTATEITNPPARLKPKMMPTWLLEKPISAR